VNKNRKIAYLALGINAIVWGASLPLVKLALDYTSPYQYLFYRYLIVVPLTFPVLIYLLYKYKPKIKKVFEIILMELVGTTLVLAILYEGLARTTAIDASLISSTAPLFVILGGILFLKEREEKREWIGVIVALFGTLIIILEPVIQNGGIFSRSSLFGNGLIFIQTIIWAIYLIIAKKRYKNVPKLLVVTISFWVGLITFGVLSFITSDAPILSDLAIPVVRNAALYMAIFGSLIGLTLYLYGQNLIEASEAALFSYLQPLIAIPLSIYILGDNLNILSIIGIVFIVLGVYLAEIRPRRV